MRSIIKGRWAIFVVWVVATIALTVFQPNVSEIIEERGQSALSADSPSVVTDNILKEMETAEGKSDIIVFYNANKLTDMEKSEIGDSMQAIKEDSVELGITEMIDPFNMPEAASSLYSEDGTTLMVSIKVDRQDRTIDEMEALFNEKLSNVTAEHYLSGEDFISNDYQTKSEAGVQKSAILTVIFILIVLIVVFRSIITPIVSLLSVAFAYLTAYGIAAQLIDKANFPVTSLTTMLLILILFGIGTDYNILLFSRFREELSHGNSIDDSIVNAYRTAGKTIAYSIVTVLIAFLSLALAKSPIYQSGVLVVVGGVMLLIEIFTLTPFVMKVLGEKLFWPSKNAAGHKESKVWGKMATISTKHSIVAFIAVLLIMLPMIFSYKESLSFNLVGELGDSSPSSKGFNIVAEHFGAGQTMTTTVAIKDNEALDSSESLAIIDRLTQNLKSIDGVKKVSSVTQPQGDPIENFYTGENKIFNMPAQVLASPSYQKVVATFLPNDKKITKLSIVLDDDPYSEAAQNTVRQIQDVLLNTMSSSELADANYGVAGTTATTAETNDVLSSDLQRTAIIVIIGVFIVLILVIRSIWAPIAIVGSLVGAYFAAATAMNVIFMDIKGLEGISSFVPFFAFIIIIALGVDYSIFLMMRFKEYPHMPVGEAIVLACKNIGGVVMSAIIILGGTFATLMPSGMVLLQELAIAVIVGLIMLCFVLLPIFLPSAMALPGTLKKIMKKHDRK